MSENVRYFAFTKWAKRHCSSCGWRYYNVNCGELSHVPQREISKEPGGHRRNSLEGTWNGRPSYYIESLVFQRYWKLHSIRRFQVETGFSCCTRSRRLVSNALQLLNRQRVQLSVQRRDQRVISNEIKQNEIVCHFSIRGLGTAKRQSL